MDGKRTPGPWKIANEAPGDDTIGVVANETIVSAVWPIEHQYAGDDPESRANAHLIAAAPELLAACKWAMESMDASGEQLPDWAMAMSAAIAKAEGGAS